MFIFFNEYLLSTYYVLDTGVRAGEEYKLKMKYILIYGDRIIHLSWFS